jgi:hypothetical protein
MLKLKPLPDTRHVIEDSGITKGKATFKSSIPVDRLAPESSIHL